MSLAPVNRAQSRMRRVSSGGIDFGLSFRTQDQFTEWLLLPVKPIVTDHPLRGWILHVLAPLVSLNLFQL